jgi:uncharacterized protein (DUF2141 family)
MRFIYLFFLLFVFSSFHSAEEGIKVTVTSLHSNDGHVLISLFKDGEGYPDDPAKAIRKAKLSIKDKKAGILFTGLPSGKYAISIMHDENNDQKLNKNVFGIPKEGYGFSNNVVGSFGPPSFSRAGFDHKATALTQVSIKMKY